MNVRSESYRKRLFDYYKALEQAASEQSEPTAGFSINRLLDDCLELPSPERERVFVEGVLTMSRHEDLQWMPKAA